MSDNRLIVPHAKMRIVDLCIYVDKYAYSDQHDREQIFNAIYNIVFSISVKNKLFKNWDDYREFALWYGGNLYSRLTNPRQNLPPDDPKYLSPIKSILNYIKKTIQLRKVDYQKQFFQQHYCEDVHPEVSQQIRHDMVSSARNQGVDFIHKEVDSYFTTIHRTIKHFLKTIPYAKDPLMSHNIYISCMMTLINQLTLSNQNKHRLGLRQVHGYNVQGFMDQVYKQEVEKSVVCYHIPQSLSNYIRVLVNRIKRLICDDIKYMVGSITNTDEVVQAILTSGFASNGEYDD